jgi:hypothetical protein
MGLLGKAIAARLSEKTVPEEIQAVIVDFHINNPLFHCVILQFKDSRQQGLSAIAAMAGSHGVICRGMSQENVLVLLPGGLDMELFSHQLANSTGSTVLFQFSAESSLLAFETIAPFL